MGAPVAVVDPAELTERLTGMLAAYVPSSEDPPSPSCPADPAPYADPAVIHVPDAAEPAPQAQAEVGTPGAGVAGVEGDPGTVVLGFADGSTVALEPGDSRTRPFLTLTDALTSR